MTDIYKKLYGYEDDIQLKDDDIKLLETGTILRKMKKEEFNDRFYRLDLTNNQLIASTKEFRKKEKICESIYVKPFRGTQAWFDRFKVFVLVFRSFDKSQRSKDGM